MSNLTTRMTDSSGSRRSARESSGQGISSPSIIRKSERLEKRAMPTTPVARKSERLVKQNTPSPLRKSLRGKIHNSSSPMKKKQSAKRFSFSDAKKKEEKKEKRIKQLISSEKHGQESICLKRKRMDARSYKALFKAQRIRDPVPDGGGKFEISDALPHAVSFESDGTHSNLLGDWECGRDVVEVVEEKDPKGANECTPVVAISANKSSDANVAANDAEGELLYSNYGETFDQIVEGQKESSGKDPGCGSTEHCRQVKNKISAMSIDSNLTAAEIGKDICAPVTEADLLPFINIRKHGFKCAECSKRQRLDYGSPEEELCSCTAALNWNLHVNLQFQDGKDIEAAVCSEPVEEWDESVQFRDTSTRCSHEKVCAVCKQAGKLLSCYGNGCLRSYHPSCLDPPLGTVPPGVWHCSHCVKKKIKFGTYSVSQGVESIWDAREVVVFDAKGTRKQKQYLVKYQGLAHFYNHWIPEVVLLRESPSLLSDFNRKNQNVRWNPDWMVPCRLLTRIQLMTSGLQDKDQNTKTDGKADCQCEWLVKWCGLDYEHATWELWNASFLCTSQGKKLITEYENRHEKAKKLLLKSSNKSIVKLQKLPAEGSIAGDYSLLDNVNKMRELWYKNQNAVILDEQERLVNVIYFVLSLLDDHRPFLITSASDSLFLWETEFKRLAPSINAVVYNGNKDVRRSIRTLEFNEEEGGMMLQVLLSPIENVIEDLDLLKKWKWEAVIIDECQRCRASVSLDLIKELETDMRVLLSNGQIKNTESEYLSLLSLLDSPKDLNKAGGLMSDPNDNLVGLKEKFAGFIAFGSKLESSKFVEYWLPVELSNLQLEQYCSTLLTNSMFLRSYLRNDPVGAIQDTFMTIRKCCDHPYLVDPSLQPLITVGLSPAEILDVGIKASGKLQLLDRILSESKSRKHRVLVLFQSSIGNGQISIGDILDDFLRQRFGPDSYERIDAVVPPSKKQGALSRFNKEGSDQFVFLLENRHLRVKLCAVDTIVIFDSELNPSNDLKALQRLSIDSQGEHINVFRLYSSYTIEEKALVLGNKNFNLDCNPQNMNLLLRWGVSCLFSRLDEFHARNSTNPAADVLSLLDDVVKDFMAVLSNQYRNSDDHDSVISKVFRSGGIFHTNCPLLGERKLQITDVDEPQIFWKKMLERRNPCWKFIHSSGPTPRNRKHVLEDISPRRLVSESEEAGNKRRKVGSADAAAIQPQWEESQVVVTEREVHKSSFHHKSSNGHSEVRSTSDGRKSLHAFLISDMEKLCEVLSLSKDVKDMVGKFLEYVMEFYHVNKEPVSILRALQISLCWIAASILKQKVDRMNSLMLAKHYLNFQCTEEEASSVYSKLRLLKKPFMQAPGTISDSISLKTLISAGEEIISQPSNAGEEIISQPSNAGEEIIRQPLNAGESSSISVIPQNVKQESKERSSDQELSPEREPNNEQAENNVEKNIKKIQRKCEKRMLKLRMKHEVEVQEFHEKWSHQMEKLEADHVLEVAVLRQIHGNSAMGINKLKAAENEFAKKKVEHVFLKKVQLKELEAKHSAEREEEMKKSAKWMAGAKSCCSQYRVADYLYIRGSEPENEIGFSMAGGKGLEKGGPLHEQHKKEQTSDKIVQATQSSDVILSDIPENAKNGAGTCVVLGETLLVPVRSISEELETSSLAPRVEESREVNHSSLCAKEIASVNIPTCVGQIDAALLADVPETGADACSLSAETIPVSVSLISERDIETASFAARIEEPREVECLPNEEATCVQDKNMCSVEKQAAARGVSHPTSVDDERPLHSNCQAEDWSQLQPASDDVAPESSQPLTAEAFDACRTLQSHRQAQVIENSDQLMRASGDVATDSIQLLASEAIYQGHSRHGNSLQNSESPSQLVEGPVELSQQPVSRGGKDKLFHPSSNVLKASDDCDLPNSQAADRSGHEPNSERSASLQLQPASDDSRTSQSHRHAQGIENSDPLQTLSVDDVLDSSSQSLAAEGNFQEHSLGFNSLQNIENPPELVEGRVEFSQQAVSHGGEDMAVHASNDVLESSNGCNPPELQVANGSDHRPNTERSASLQNTRDPSNVTENAAELPNHSLQQSGRNLGIIERPRNCSPPGHARHPGHRNVATFSQNDPLQNNLERMRKEMEQAMKAHDNTKLQLKSACEKEIEEMVAQIRDKYDAKNKDADTAFSQKKTEIDYNMNIILMNKILAEAFRSKCLDAKRSGISGTQRVVPSSYMQQLNQLTLPPMTRHSPVPSFSSASQPATGQQITTPSVQSIQHAMGTVSTSSARPPQIGAITPTTVNARVAGDIRAPAPHLQPFRSPACMSSANLSSVPCNIPDQQVAATSPMLPPLQPRELMSIPVQLFHQQNPPFQPAQLVTSPVSNMNQSFSDNRQSGISVQSFSDNRQSGISVQSGTSNSSLSAVQLLRDVRGKHSEPGLLPRSTDFGSKSDALNLPNTQTLASTCSIRTSSAPAADIVCLSDDDD